MLSVFLIIGQIFGGSLAGGIVGGRIDDVDGYRLAYDGVRGGRDRRGVAYAFASLSGARADFRSNHSRVVTVVRRVRAHVS